MKYQSQIIINCPLQDVITYFCDLPQRTEWQKGLETMELISGVALNHGAVSKLVIRMGDKTSEMTEYILENHLPEHITARYETEGVKNISKDTFESLDESCTKYVSFQEFRMENSMMKAMSLLMKRMFIRQTEETLQAFKEYCETQKSGN